MGASAERALASEVCLQVPPPSWANYVLWYFSRPVTLVSANRVTAGLHARGRDSRKHARWEPRATQCQAQAGASNAEQLAEASWERMIASWEDPSIGIA